MGARSIRTSPAAKARFIEALGRGESVTAACRAAGIGRRTAYDERQRDEGFALDWTDALEAGTDALEDEATRRALDGSDRLLEFMLKARRPDKYRERQEIHHTGEAQPLTAADLARCRAAGADPANAEAIERVARMFAEAEHEQDHPPGQ